jgi:uncharacterized membrane protein YadS
MSSVVAASTAYGAAASHTAVVVKLTRTLMIIPICLGLSATVRRREKISAEPPCSGAPVHVRVLRLVPGFLLGFLALAAANSAGLIPSADHHGLSDATTLLITVALSAVGLSIDTAGLRRTGLRPIVLGAVLWVAVALTSLALQHVTAGV